MTEKPTIHELEAILDDNAPGTVSIQPDGSVKVTSQRRPVWLRTEGIHVVVLIQEGDDWKEIIRETRDAEISHIWEDND